MSTLKRPVPLEFHIYFSGDIFKVVDSTRFEFTLKLKIDFPKTKYIFS